MEKEWEELENIPAWQLTKVRNNKMKKGIKVENSCYVFDGFLSSHKIGVRASMSEVQRQSRAPR